MVDSHTHLHICKDDTAGLVADAVAAGINRMVTIGTDIQSSRLALTDAERFAGSGVYAAVGIHPNSATGCSDEDFEQLLELGRHDRCVAIGETGLDYFRNHAPHGDQARAFQAQAEIARRLDKPLVIHTREADDDTLAMLNEHASGLKVILHCFSMGSRIDECLEHDDWWISFAGNVTYPANQALRNAALKVPSRRLLVETDAPYLAPQGQRGKPNKPVNVITTAEAVALERRVPYYVFNTEIEAVSAAVFGW